MEARLAPIPIAPLEQAHENRGSKGAVREVLRHLKENRFVVRTDIKFYYASIDHELLLDRLARSIDDTPVLNLS